MVSLFIFLAVAANPAVFGGGGSDDPFEGFSANLRQTLLIELVSEPRTRSVLGKRASDQVRKRTQVGGAWKAQNGRKKCEKLSEHQKYARLEAFLVNTPREASRYFPPLLPTTPSSSLAADPEADPSAGTLMDFVQQNDDPAAEMCDDRCREIERKLTGAISEQGEWEWAGGGKEPQPPPFRLEDDVVLVEEAEEGGEGSNSANSYGVTRVRRGDCTLERFVPIGNCTAHGFEESLGDEKLCTACQGIFVLNKNCFPVFVNSVVCDRRESECIFDRLSGSAQGKCLPKMLTFKVMRNKGTADCEHWVYEYLEVPVACECFLSKRSVWLEAVPPSIA